MKVKGVFFDMDGLLVDSERITRDACKYAGEKCNVDFTDDFYGTLIGKSDDDSDRMLFHQFGSNFPIDDFKKLVFSKMKELLHDPDLLKPGARNIVEYTHELKIPMGLVTSSHFDDVRERLGSLTDYFSTIVTRDDVTRGKPAPDLYLEGISRLNLHPDECIVFEDSPAGSQAALNAGLKVVIIPDLVRPDDQLKNQALMICEDLFEALDYLKPMILGIY